MARTITYTDETALGALLTQRDLVDCLDDDGDGQADEAVIAACVDAACDEIDSAFLMRGVPVPVDVAVETAVPLWTRYLFVAHGYARRMVRPESTAHGEMIKVVRGMLAQIASGKMQVASLKAQGGGTVDGVAALPGEGSVVDVVAEESLTTSQRTGRFFS